MTSREDKCRSKLFSVAALKNLRMTHTYSIYCINSWAVLPINLSPLNLALKLCVHVTGKTGFRGLDPWLVSAR